MRVALARSGMPRARWTVTYTVAIWMAATALPAESSSRYDLLRQLVDGDRRERREAAKQLVEAEDPSLVPGLVDALFFIPAVERGPALKALRALTGENAGRRYLDWVELIGRRDDLEPAPGYLEWKRELLSLMDKRYGAVLYPGAPARIRLEEVVSGGVAFEGIPALDDPPHVPADEAKRLRDDEQVFGITLGGEARAYPLRYLSWHEMTNDVLGGEPFALSYCTLCGSGIAWSAETPDGSRRTFGTSGLLYRSNKLMVDRQSYTLWSNLTGEPVVGRLARSPSGLEMLPMTLTTWGAWKREHPKTTVVYLDPGDGARWGFTYEPGLADRARAGVAFPVWQQSDVLERNAEIYGLRLGEAAKAYPLESLHAKELIHDRLGDTDVVLVVDPDSQAVRAFHSDGRRFRMADEPGVLQDDEENLWRVTEQALEPEGSPTPSSEAQRQPPTDAQLQPLPRIPGHRAFWFGWYGFFPHTEVYAADTDRR